MYFNGELRHVPILYIYYNINIMLYIVIIPFHYLTYQ